jgi:DNA invertase Pin-like site-specific DNA recombinase
MGQGQRVGYIRVSSEGQNTARQLEGVQVDRTFEEKISGKNTNRPQLESMLAYVRQGDEVLAHDMSRLARNLDDLRRLVRDLTGRGVRVTFIKEGMTFTGEDSPMSTLMLSMMGAFAEFERSLILDRQREGIAIAKTEGKYKGRKPTLTPAQATQLRARAQKGEKKTALAAEYGISRETLYAYIRAGSAA